MSAARPRSTSSSASSPPPARPWSSSSSYLPELLGLCDTIGVMCRGELTAVRPRAEWTEAEILRVATGSA
jgi:hypothetical protein